MPCPTMLPTRASEQAFAYSWSTVGLAGSQSVSCSQLMPETAFFTVFCAMHPDYYASTDLRFRLRLLKFTVMFTKRSASEEVAVLQDLSHQHQEQAVFLQSSDNKHVVSGFPMLTEHLISSDDTKIEKITKDRVGQGSTAASPRSTTYDLFRPATSLLDTIPLFMAVSAAQISMQGGTITDTWMRLAAGYMAQAVAEQYLVYGSQHQEVIQEAFSWGFDPECGADVRTFRSLSLSSLWH